MVSYVASPQYATIEDMSLNPCCNGRWSRTNGNEDKAKQHYVLILVVMEDGLVPSDFLHRTACSSLNPCCNGRWSRTHYNKFCMAGAIQS